MAAETGSTHIFGIIVDRMIEIPTVNMIFVTSANSTAMCLSDCGDHDRQQELKCFGVNLATATVRLVYKRRVNAYLATDLSQFVRTSSGCPLLLQSLADTFTELVMVKNSEFVELSSVTVPDI